MQSLDIACQTADSYQAEFGQVVCDFLLIRVLAGLHAALLQGVVIVEEVDEQVPEHAGVVQMGLQEEIHREGAHTLDCQGSSFW